MNHSIDILKNRNKYLTNKMKDIITPFIYEKMSYILEQCKDYKKKNKLNIHELRILQDFLVKDVPLWTPEYLAIDISNMKIKSVQGNLIDKIITNIIKNLLNIYSIKIKNFEYNSNVPNDTIVKIYKETAREIYIDPYKLYSNSKEMKEIIHNAIDKVIEDLIPINYILETSNYTLPGTEIPSVMEGGSDIKKVLEKSNNLNSYLLTNIETTYNDPKF